MTRRVADHSQAIAINPNHPTAYLNRGADWDANGEYGKAIMDFTEAIRLNPGYAKAYQRWGNCYRKGGDEATACEDFALADKLEARALHKTEKGKDKASGVLDFDVREEQQ